MNGRRRKIKIVPNAKHRRGLRHLHKRTGREKRNYRFSGNKRAKGSKEIEVP